MPRGLNLKRIFRRQDEPLYPFKQFNALNRLSPDELKEILLFSEREVFLRSGCGFADKKVFFLHENGTVPLAEKILAQKTTLLHYQHSTQTVGISSASYFPVCGGLKPLAVASDVFDAAIVPAASRFDRDTSLLLPELVRGLKNGGRLSLTVIHPTLEIFLTNQNPASVSRARFGLEHYAAALRANQLFLESIHEGVIDKDLKPFFEEAQDFNELQGIPLVLYLRSVKFIKT